MTKQIALLGSTGSIGTQALEVARLNGYRITALAAHSNTGMLETQIREFRPNIACVADETKYKELQRKVADTSTKVVCGFDGLCACAVEAHADTVLNSVVGMVGLVPTLEAIRAGKDIALANKETLVTGGKLVMQAASEKGVKILPVDSEHSAIFQCLEASPRKEALKRIILTASGGPFFGYTGEQLKAVTKAQALKHPNWAMGAKITIDSATMMNKGLELIEAVWLFGLPPEQIDIIVHRQSVIHSLIEFQDNSVLAQLGVPDMQIPIQYALTYPERISSNARQLDFKEYSSLTFFEPDEETFSSIRICREAITRGGLAPTAANAANEEAVKLFLEDKIAFYEIPYFTEKAVNTVKDVTEFTVEDILETERACRALVRDGI